MEKADGKEENHLRPGDDPGGVLVRARLGCGEPDSHGGWENLVGTNGG